MNYKDRLPSRPSNARLDTMDGYQVGTDVDQTINTLVGTVFFSWSEKYDTPQAHFWAYKEYGITKVRRTKGGQWKYTRGHRVAICKDVEKAFQKVMNNEIQPMTLGEYLTHENEEVRRLGKKKSK